jgi:hypothetical protein
MRHFTIFSLQWCTFQLLARQQAQREEELGQSQRHILALQVSLSFAGIFFVLLFFPCCCHVILFICFVQQEIEELERENRLHDQQVGTQQNFSFDTYVSCIALIGMR